MWTGDWSSDVCSSDLVEEGAAPAGLACFSNEGRARLVGTDLDHGIGPLGDDGAHGGGHVDRIALDGAQGRSEERRVGKECRWGGAGAVGIERGEVGRN